MQVRSDRTSLPVIFPSAFSGDANLGGWGKGAVGAGGMGAVGEKRAVAIGGMGAAGGRDLLFLQHTNHLLSYGTLNLNCCTT